MRTPESPAADSAKSRPGPTGQQRVRAPTAPRQGDQEVLLHSDQVAPHHAGRVRAPQQRAGGQEALQHLRIQEGEKFMHTYIT